MYANSPPPPPANYHPLFGKFSLDYSTRYRKWVVAKITEHRVGSQGYANSSFECCIRIKGTMMDRDPFVAVTPKDNLWIRISTVMD